MSICVELLARGILDRAGSDCSDHVESIMSLSQSSRDALVNLLVPHAIGRRWLRSHLLSRLPVMDAASLARRLMTFVEDFASGTRDSTTAQVVQALPLKDVIGSAEFFAGSNAAGSFWKRVAVEQPDSIPDLAHIVLDSADSLARETTLSILLLDPYSEVQLAGSPRASVLVRALDDSEESVRGIAADVLADEDPERLALDLDRLMYDSSERVRVAAWDAAFASDFERTRGIAFDMVLDESASLGPRRTALTALSAVLTTNEIAPLLEVLVSHPDQTLAEDAVNLLWQFHRNPIVATAASESPHVSVREVAQRLLHPETGSPAAGGSRPGAPNAARDIYEEMLKGYERRDD